MASVFRSPIETGAWLELWGALLQRYDSSVFLEPRGNHIYSTCISEIFSCVSRRMQNISNVPADVQIEKSRVFSRQPVTQHLFFDKNVTRFTELVLLPPTPRTAACTVYTCDLVLPLVHRGIRLTGEEGGASWKDNFPFQQQTESLLLRVWGRSSSCTRDKLSSFKLMHIQKTLHHRWPSLTVMTEHLF